MYKEILNKATQSQKVVHGWNWAWRTDRVRSEGDHDGKTGGLVVSPQGTTGSDLWTCMLFYLQNMMQ
jgi:hypothetical protein